MSAEAVVYALLTASGAVGAVVGARIFPVALPERTATPAIVYDLVSSVRTGAIDAAETTHRYRSRVQVNLLGADYAVLHSLRGAVVAALQFQRGSIAGVAVHSITPDGEGSTAFDQDLGLYFRPLDFLVLHTSA